MKLTEKLDVLMAEKGLNRREFSAQSGIPYMTIVNFYEKGTDNVKLSTLKKIAVYFSVSLDYITDDTITDRGNVSQCEHSLSPNEIEIVFAYRQASADDKNIVDSALRKYISAPRLTLVAARDGGLSTADANAIDRLGAEMQEDDADL